MASDSPTPNCGATVRTARGLATCTDHGLGHYDPVLDLSWPTGNGPFVMATPAAPSPVDTTEPPADACDACLLPHGPFCADNGCARRPEPPAETQQDDEVPLVGAADRATARRVVGDWLDRGHSTSVVGLDELRAGIATALASRPSADTETLRDALLDVLGAVDELLRQPADGTPRGALAAARDRARRCLDRLSR